MTYGVQSAVLSALAHMRGVMPTASVPVTINGVSGYGLRQSVAAAAEQTVVGNMDPNDGAVFINASTFGAVTTNSEQTIDGCVCTITEATTDAVTGLVKLAYRKTRPVT